MAKIFKITPKRTKKEDDWILTPEMTIIITTKQITNDPFYNGAKEIKKAYMQQYKFDYQKANCSKNDFDFELFGTINENKLKKLVVDYGLSIKENLKYQLVISKDKNKRVGINILSEGHTNFNIEDFKELVRLNIGYYPVKYIELVSFGSEKIESIIELR